MAKHKWYDVIVAWANGEEVQCYNPNSNEWIQPNYPSFETELEWRVKPKQSMYRLFTYKEYNSVFVALKNYSEEYTENLIYVESRQDTIWLTDWLPLEKKGI